MKKALEHKQGNKYAVLATPEQQLDFHQSGPLTSAQIIQKTENFLSVCQKEKSQPPAEPEVLGKPLKGAKALC